jgi:lipid II isoglutaminyl synthase (glutamine-hydrolysing)
MLAPKIAAARAAGRVARAAGRGGTSLPGKVLLRLEPGALRALAERLPRGSAVISATNGKTTTAAMAAAILERHGLSLVHNRAGANMAGGVASTLLDAARGDGIAGDLGLFEVDEFWLADVVAAVRPRALVLANLFRDQLDRYGELDTIAERWAAIAASSDMSLVLNADDPTVADLGRERAGVSYFGVEDRAMALPGMQHASDAKHCRNCGHPYAYEASFMGHLGIYACPNCGRTRPEPTVSAHDIRLAGTRSAAFTLRTPAGETRIALPLPGLYNVYNALAAAALALALEVPLATIAAGLEAVSPAFGRAETVALAGRELTILLVKNPAGANEVLRTLALEPGELDVLGVLNDNIADGRDISWVWDADFEMLAPHARRIVCAGTRAGELALRLKYAGVPVERLEVVPELGAALDAGLAGEGDRLFALPTYTAMLELQSILTKRGATTAYWNAA